MIPLSFATARDVAQLDANIALLPIGSWEQHGAHLPMTTDSLVAIAIAEQVAGRLGAVTLPPITVSCSQEHAGYGVGCSVSATTLWRQVSDMIAMLTRNGTRMTVLINGHGGNYLLGNLAQEANLDGPQVFLGPQRAHWEAACRAASIETSVSEDMHGGEIETSILLRAWPDSVRTDLIADHLVADRRLLQMTGLRPYAEAGIVGRPSLATADKGRRLLESLGEQIAADVSLLMAPS